MVGSEAVLTPLVNTRRKTVRVPIIIASKGGMVMRTRTRNTDGKTETSILYSSSRPYGCDTELTTTPSDPTDWVSYNKSEVMHDVVTPRYAARSAEGQIINSPMDRTTIITRDNPASYSSRFAEEKWNTSCNPSKWCEYETAYEWVDKPSSYFLPGGLNDLPELPAYDDTAICDLALTNAWSSVDLSEVQGLVTVAESGKTVASLISMAGRFIKIIKMIKRLDSKGLLYEFTPSQLSDRYMELRYAIRPLMYDCVNLSNALQTEAVEKPTRRTFRGWEMYSDEDYEESFTWAHFTHELGDIYYKEKLAKTWNRQVDVRAGVLCQVEALNALSIYGLTQPVEAIWELIPFSFVVDWFFNVGKTIAAWSPEYGTKALASWYVVNTTEYQRVAHWHDSYQLPDDSGSLHLLEWYRALSDCWCDRTTVTQARVPNPVRAVVPTFSLRLDTLKLADLLIIAKQLIGGGLKSMPMGLRT